MEDELLEVVDKGGKVIGSARRSELHEDPRLLHRVVHVLVFNRRGQLLLQKRSRSKDVAPGLWDTSVGGHVAPGEGTASAALRELGEELGLTAAEPVFLYRYIFANSHESELVDTYRLDHEGPFTPGADEVEEVRFWHMNEIEGALGTGIFSPQFEKEFAVYGALLRQTPRSSGP